MPIGLLAVIPTMLAHWVYYFYPWASAAHSRCLYLLLIPWACWLSFLPRWPIGFIILFLGFPQRILSLPLIDPKGLLATIPATFTHWVYYLFPWVPRPIYIVFTSYWSHRLVGYHSCHVGLLGLLPLINLIFSPFPYYWASSTVGSFVKIGPQH